MSRCLWLLVLLALGGCSESRQQAGFAGLAGLRIRSPTCRFSSLERVIA